jgi:hypothetical protein
MVLRAIIFALLAFVTVQPPPLPAALIDRWVAAADLDHLDDGDFVRSWSSGSKASSGV